ncbi:conserved hypothetical protein [Ricinus communis]|uniref:Uncharacterized protein n=1 Tax=Ricinus communis TaxID=3988 RepID=B9TGU0_RICCO|nr:conserved hypothetical protein [Ricinus communis]
MCAPRRSRSAAPTRPTPRPILRPAPAAPTPSRCRRTARCGPGATTATASWATRRSVPRRCRPRPRLAA